jgi:hypothetical protein
MTFRRASLRFALPFLLVVVAAACGGISAEAPTDGEGAPGVGSASDPPANEGTPGAPGSGTTPPSSGGHGGQGAPNGSAAGSTGRSAPACTTKSPPLDDAVRATSLWSGELYLDNYPPTDVPNPDPGGAGYTIRAISTLTTDATSVYWSYEDATANKIRILEAPLGGGTPVTLASLDGSVGPANELAVDADNLYFQTSYSSLAKVPLDGSGKVTFFDLPDEYEAGGFALDGDDIYFTAVNLQGNLDALLMRIPKAGGHATQLAQSHSGGSPGGGGVVLDATNVYWENVSTSTTFHEIGCGGECETAETFTEVLSVPRAGGKVTTLATTPPSLQQAGTTTLAVDADSVYFVSQGSLVSVPIGGGAVKTIASSPWVPDSFAFDGTSFYWGAVSCTGALVARVAKTGGPVTSLLEVDGAQAVSTAVAGPLVFSLYGVSDPSLDGKAAGSLARIAAP